MSDDRQDFLERREARRRRMEQRSGQKPPVNRPSKPAGQPPKPRQPAPKADRKASDAPKAEAESKAAQQANPTAQVGAGKKARPKEETIIPALPKPPEVPKAQEPSPTGRVVGRRTAARRQEELAAITAAPAGPKPPLLTRLIIWGTAAICGLLILATLGEAWTVHRLNQQIVANQQAANQLQQQNQQLSNSIQQLQQASTIEQEARKLGFIFPGDQPVVIVTSTPPVTAPQPTTSPSQGWWGFWPDWLKLFLGG